MGNLNVYLTGSTRLSKKKTKDQLRFRQFVFYYFLITEIEIEDKTSYCIPTQNQTPPDMHILV